MVRMLIVEDDPDFRQEICEELEARIGGQELRGAATVEEALAVIREWRPQVILVDLGLPRTAQAAQAGEVDPTGGELVISEAARLSPEPVQIVLSAAHRELAVRMLIEHREISDYLFKDTPWPEAAARIERFLDDARRREELATAEGIEIVGASACVAKLRQEVDLVAREETATLVLGESGTGKELVARRIHALSPRAHAPFVAVNCAALTESLLEAELFGHVRGAFTGAVSDRPGRIEAARKGTLFLDEIGELAAPAQAKLLRVLEQRTFERVGSDRTLEADFRLVAATNQDLESSVREKAFRQDLYYRIAVFPIHTPPLRERSGDIPALLEHFLDQLRRRRRRPVSRVTDEALALLRAYPWPGNVRELRNVTERLVILAQGGPVTAELTERVLGGVDSSGYRVQVPPEEQSYMAAKDRVLEAFNREFLSRALARNKGNILRTADEIGYNRRNLSETLRQVGLDPADYK